MREQTDSDCVRCGCIVFDAARERVLLVQNKSGKQWGLPKGHLEPGEHIIACACRELREETGVSIWLQSFAPAVTLPYNAIYYITTINEAEHTIHVATGDREISRVEWVPISELANFRGNAGLRAFIGFAKTAQARARVSGTATLRTS